MSNLQSGLEDKFHRVHDYLRISLTERCNLRCTYCMPEHGIPIKPQSMLMSKAEILDIASVFVEMGVQKIRLTGGEPLVRKDFKEILQGLSTLGVDLCMTTNGLLVDRFMEDLEAYGLTQINVSLDTLCPVKYEEITRRPQLEKVMENIQTMITRGFNVKLNVVLMRNFNENEIVDFVEWTKENPMSIRFIEFMPFDGNSWDMTKVVGQSDILDRVAAVYGSDRLIKLDEERNFTSRGYQIEGHKGQFGIISSVTNPFCDGCNRIRLTADGKIKNCLFSNEETDLLTPLRQGQNIVSVIQQSLHHKLAVRSGMDSLEKLSNSLLHNDNRSMIAIGG